jgi:ElaA protein
MQWFCKHFNQLDTQTLYDILRIRVDIFVVEQTCYYPELDGIDCLKDTLHVYAIEEGKIIAYLRCIAPGETYEHDSAIGRVLINEQARGRGLGHDLIKAGIKACEQAWPAHDIHLSAQEHLQSYYLQHSFETVSDMYLEDHIPHINMLRKANC